MMRMIAMVMLRCTILGDGAREGVGVSGVVLNLSAQEEDSEEV